ncbi:MAG: 50S ribosomal protein L17 [SAR324 cluster bacterium]|nr:50S ribosomal protein L17 [SAR324 cluster bacterium]
MRHLKAGRRLGVTTSHRRAMMRNLITSLIEHEQITCTVARAKELRKPLDKMITLGKQGDLNARRQALKFIKSKEAMAALFGDLAERYKDREGGYSRIIKLGSRRLGDGSHMVIVQLIDGPNDVLSELKNKSAKKKPKETKSSVLEEVSQEVANEESTVAPISETEKEESSISGEKNVSDDSQDQNKNVENGTIAEEKSIPAVQEGSESDDTKKS